MTRLKLPRRHLLGAFAAALAVSFGAASPAVANVKCKPNVRVTNLKGASIKVINFKYKIGNNTIHTEGLANKILTPNEIENWPSQTLNDAATGVVITSSAIGYQDDTGPGYGPTKTSAWFPHSFTCNDTHNYIATIQ